MISRLAIALGAVIALSSCTSGDYKIASRQGVEMPCYSTWHYLPHNS